MYRAIKPLRPLLARKSQAVRALSESHVYVDQCGISFNDGRLKFLVYNIAVLLPGLLMRVPIVKSAQAMGPFHSRINRLSAKIFLPRLHRIFARGHITLSHLQSLGLTNVSESTDLALAFPAARCAQMEDTDDVEEAEGLERIVVGIAPSAVAARKAASAGIDYVQTITRLIDSIAEQRHDLVLFAHSARPDSQREHNNDLPLCRAVHAALKRPAACRLIDQELTATELRKLIGSCHYLITSRFHAMVGALTLAVPGLVIGWSHKYAEVLVRFCLTDQAIDYRQCRDANLLARFDDMVEHHDEIRAKISEVLPKVRDLAFGQVAFIRQTAASSAESTLNRQKVRHVERK
ncbi:MAG: polysaccharide pyruvyl transferase family protein [Xanthomonadales bacterium]|nr:polysaccharide pyruvyl transferase family protein [Xanthomonadales bacterium]